MFAHTASWSRNVMTKKKKVWSIMRHTWIVLILLRIGTGTTSSTPICQVQTHLNGDYTEGGELEIDYCIKFWRYLKTNVSSQVKYHWQYMWHGSVSWAYFMYLRWIISQSRHYPATEQLWTRNAPVHKEQREKKSFHELVLNGTGTTQCSWRSGGIMQVC